MKKTTLLILINLIINIVLAQEDDKLNLKLRHLKGMQAIEAKVLYAKLGTAYELNYGYYINNNYMLHAGINYERSKLQYTNIEYRNIKLGGIFTFTSYKNRLYLNGTLSGIIGQIVLNRPIIDSKTAKFNYGFAPGINSEIYILNKLSLILSFEQQFNFKDDLGVMHYNVGGGLRIYIK